MASQSASVACPAWIASKAVHAATNHGSASRNRTISRRISLVAVIPTARVLGVIRTSLRMPSGCRTAYSAARFAPRSAQADRSVRGPGARARREIVYEPVAAIGVGVGG